MGFKLPKINIHRALENFASSISNSNGSSGSTGSTSTTPSTGTTSTTPKPKLGIKEKMDRKYGTGTYSRTDKSKKPAMKPGESQYQYNTRMQQEEMRAQRKAEKTMHDPDKDEIPTGVDATPYGNVPPEQQAVSVNPNDLRPRTDIVPNVGNILPTPPGHRGDPYQYAQLPDGGYAFKHANDTGWTEATGESLKAIEERYKDVNIPEVEEVVDMDNILPTKTKYYRGKKE